MSIQIPVRSLSKINLCSYKLPRIIKVKQKTKGKRIYNLYQVFSEMLQQQYDLQRLTGKRVAITVGSRGVQEEIIILQTLVIKLKSIGAIPYIIPSMGSHGCSTTFGQKHLLSVKGITETTTGAPLFTSMETMELMKLNNGAVFNMNRAAYECDNTIVIGHIKPHAGKYQEIGSGLCKMSIIGLGNQKGARSAHLNGVWETIRAASPYLETHTNIAFGIAIVENSEGYINTIEIVQPKEFYSTDNRLLQKAEKMINDLPVDDLDVLVVHEMGKNISGVGMNPHIIGSGRIYGTESRKLNYHQIVVLNLTDESCGNYMGLGQSDFTTLKFIEKADPTPTYINLFTSLLPGNRTTEVAIPPALKNDREAIQASLFTTQLKDKPKLIYILNTSRLSEFYISETLASDFKIVNNANIVKIGELKNFDFNHLGNLNWD